MLDAGRKQIAEDPQSDVPEQWDQELCQRLFLEEAENLVDQATEPENDAGGSFN
ncbi:MAG: hypothetical protein RIC55_20540 [Pirellulaceae bacterium]